MSSPIKLAWLGMCVTVQHTDVSAPHEEDRVYLCTTQADQVIPVTQRQLTKLSVLTAEERLDFSNRVSARIENALKARERHGMRFELLSVSLLGGIDNAKIKLRMQTRRAFEAVKMRIFRFDVRREILAILESELQKIY